MQDCAALCTGGGYRMGMAKGTSNMQPDVEPAAEWVDIQALTPWKRNPRKNDDNVKRVMASIKRFGFSAPIVARKADGEVITGHDIDCMRAAGSQVRGRGDIPQLLRLDRAEMVDSNGR